MARYNSVLRHLKMEDVKAKNEWRRNVEKAKQIALQEQQYLLHFTQNFSVPKYYDWKAGKFNENSLIEINRIILKRLQEIDNALSEGMTTKDFKYLYGGIAVDGIVSLNPELVSSAFAQDIINASGEVTSHMFGPDFPGSHINSIGDFDKPESLSKVDAQAHLAHATAAKAAADSHTDHDFAYQATDYVLPTAEQMITNVTTVSSGDFFGNQMKQMIWPNYGQQSPIPGTDAHGNLSSYSYPWNDHVFPDNAYFEGLGYDMSNLTAAQQERVIRDRVSFTGGKYGGVSGTYHEDNDFLDITYGTARSIDETSFDIVAGAIHNWDDPNEWPDIQYLDLGPGWGWIYRNQIGNPRYNTTKEHWQYQENEEDFYVSHLEDIIGVRFPAVKDEKYLDGDEIYNSHLQPGGFDTNMDDGDLPGDNTVNYAGAYNECSAHKKIIQNAHAGDVITFTFRVATDQWDNTEGYDINGDGDGPYNDVTGDPNELYVVAGERIMKVWSLYKELPDAETTDAYGFVLRNTESAIDSGTFSYTIQQEDINPTTGALDFVTAYHADDFYFSRVSISNFTVNAGEKYSTGQLGKTTDAYDLGYSVYKSVQTKPKGKKKKDDEEEEEGNVTSTTTGGVVDAETDADAEVQTDTDVDTDTSIEPEVKKEVKQSENIPDNEEQEEQIIDDLEEQEQEEDEQIEQEKETDEIESEKEKFLDELQGDEEATEDEKNIFSDIFDKVIDYAAEITGHRTSKEVLKLYNAYLKGANYVQGDINRYGEVDLFGGFSNTSDYNPYVSYKDQAYLRSALNDPEFEKIHAKAMNANNEKSKHLYLHALGDKVEAKIQDYILGNKGLRNSLFQGVKLDRNAFLQSNGKYISFTKDYKFRPGGSVAEAEKSWVGKLLSGFGFKLDTLGAGNAIDMIGGLLAGKLLDGADQYGDLYNAPVMPMRFNLHYRGGGNIANIPYRSNGWSSNVNDINPEAIRGGYVNRGSWWEEDPELGAMQEISPWRYSQNYTPELIGPDHKLNPRTGEWELPRDEQGNRIRYVDLLGDDFWWLDPDFVDLSGYGQRKEKQQEDPVDNVYDDLSATDAATLVAMQRKKKKKRGQGGRKLGDTTKRGGEVNESWINWIKKLPKKKLLENKNNSPYYEKKLEIKRANKIEREKRKQELALERQKIKNRTRWSQQKKPKPNPNELYPGQPSPNGFPDTPPPQLAPNGYHPEFGKRANRYRRLDPHSAAAMPKTGDPETDAQVAAAKKKTRARWLKRP